MQLFSGLVLMQMYARNLIVMYFNRLQVELLQVEPHIALGLSPVHCLLNVYFIFKVKAFLIHLEGYNKNSPSFSFRLSA